MPNSSFSVDAVFFIWCSVRKAASFSYPPFMVKMAINSRSPLGLAKLNDSNCPSAFSFITLVTAKCSKSRSS
ncbi:hypothetical protein D3C75_1320270 [compost metagenome]